MTVIRDEYISKDITMHDVLPLGFLKKSRYTGEKGKMRYLMEKAETEVPSDESSAAYAGEGLADSGAPQGDAENAGAVKTVTKLRACVWRGPFAYDHTDDGLKTDNFFEFSDEGIKEAVKWLNEKLPEFQ